MIWQLSLFFYIQVKNSVTEETDASNTKIEKKASHKLVESNDSDGKPSDPKGKYLEVILIFN